MHAYSTGSADLATGSRVRLIENANPTVPGGKVYEVDFYADSFTQIDILAGGNSETGFSLSMSFAEDLVCYNLDPHRVGKQVVS